MQIVRIGLDLAKYVFDQICLRGSRRGCARKGYRSQDAASRCGINLLRKPRCKFPCSGKKFPCTKNSFPVNFRREFAENWLRHRDFSFENRLQKRRNRKIPTFCRIDEAASVVSLIRYFEPRAMAAFGHQPDL
jgi:hypothetical protein